MLNDFYPKVQKRNNRFHILDYMKFMCAFLIIGLHTISDQGIGVYIKLFCRIGVPLFALCSGFLLYDKIKCNADNRKSYIIKYVKRLFVLDIIWSILYLPIYWETFELDGLSWYKVLYSLIFVFWSRGISTQLWYLSSLAVCTIIIYFIFSFTKHSFKWLYFIGGICYVFCLLGDNYYGIIDGSVLQPIWNSYINCWGSVWNSFMSILIFVVIGADLKRKYNEDKINSKTKFIIIFIVFYYMENIVLKINGISKGDSASIFLLPLVYSIFIFLISVGENKLKRPMHYRKSSMYIYLCHFAVLEAVNQVLRYNSTFPLSILCFIIVCLVSYIISILCIFIEKSINTIIKRLKNN